MEENGGYGDFLPSAPEEVFFFSRGNGGESWRFCSRGGRSGMRSGPRGEKWSGGGLGVVLTLPPDLGFPSDRERERGAVSSRATGWMGGGRERHKGFGRVTSSGQ